MQILFNELSLEGQFSDTDTFITVGLLKFIEVLKEMEHLPTILLNKSDTWNRKVTSKNTLYSILVSSKSDEVRRFKSAIVSLTLEPFWDSESKQNVESNYHLNGVDIRGTSPAEACERDKVLTSFIASTVSGNPLHIDKDGTQISLLNLTCSGELTEDLWVKKLISFETYLKSRFSNGKLDLSKIDKNTAWSKIQPTEQSLFIDTFRKFEKLTWNQIYTDGGLQYTEYHNTIGSSYSTQKTYKFRASQKIRCHGYREKNSFVVINFEVDHALSDKG